MCEPNPDAVIAELRRLLRDAAPEQSEGLDALLGEIEPRFVLDETDTRKGMRARPETREICVSLPVLKRQLAMAFGYVKTYRAVSRLSEEPEGIRLQPEGDEQFDTGVRLLQWALIEGFRAAVAEEGGGGEGSDEGWPEDLPFPHPESPPDSDARIAIELYYMALATDLHHELNHLRLGHTGEAEDAVGQELDADVQAAEWILADVSPDNPAFEKRILGVVLSHLYDMFLQLEGFVADPSHPPLAARLWHRPAHYLVDQDNHVAWMFIASALSVHCGLANQPRPIDHSQRFDTARAAVDYLLNLYDPPQA